MWGRQLDGQDEERKGHFGDSCGLGIRWGPPTEGNSWHHCSLQSPPQCLESLRGATGPLLQAPPTVAPQSPGIHTLKCGVYVTLDGTEGILVMLFLPDDCKMTSCRNKWNKRGELRSSPNGQPGGPKGRDPALNW